MRNYNILSSFMPIIWSTGKMHSDFDPDKVNWLALIHDNGDRQQQQYGGSNYSPFVGLPYQQGAGIGSILRSLLRFLMPIGREAGAAIGRQGLESGVRVLSSVLEQCWAAGRNVRQSLEHEGRAGLKNLLDKASNNLARRQESGGAPAFDKNPEAHPHLISNVIKNS